jgi:Flp pilus assembly protein TadD
MGRIEDAIADYSKAIELDPRNASSFNSRGLALDRCVCARGDH